MSPGLRAPSAKPLDRISPAALEFPKLVPRVDVVADCRAAKVGGGGPCAPGSPGRRGADGGSARCFAERGGCRAPDPAHRPRPAALPGAAGQGPPLGDVSVGASVGAGAEGGTRPFPGH